MNVTFGTYSLVQCVTHAGENRQFRALRKVSTGGCGAVNPTGIEINIIEKTTSRKDTGLSVALLISTLKIFLTNSSVSQTIP